MYCAVHNAALALCVSKVKIYINGSGGAPIFLLCAFNKSKYHYQSAPRFEKVYVSCLAQVFPVWPLRRLHPGQLRVQRQVPDGARGRQAALLPQGRRGPEAVQPLQPQQQAPASEQLRWKTDLDSKDLISVLHYTPRCQFL